VGQVRDSRTLQLPESRRGLGSQDTTAGDAGVGAGRAIALGTNVKVLSSNDLSSLGGEDRDTLLLELASILPLAAIELPSLLLHI
jgi:hypothetical protein